jgi:hypothetical protein
VTLESDAIDDYQRREAQEAERRHHAAQRFLLAQLAAAYEATANPLCVWSAWQLCRRGDHELPAWVSGYFDRFAETVLAWPTHPPLGQLAEAVGEALGFGFSQKDENPLTDWRERREGEQWFAAVEAHLAAGLSLTRAYREVAVQVHRTEATVRRRIEKFAAAFGTTPEKLARWRQQWWLEQDRESRAALDGSAAPLAAAPDTESDGPESDPRR